VLGECWRVLGPGGRLCIACLSKEGGVRWMLGLYEWAHATFPTWVDCRPINPEGLLAGSGFRIQSTFGGTMWGLPVQVVLAGKA
jgi:hypothetical protein